jgi:hypothetical protein
MKKFSQYLILLVALTLIVSIAEGQVRKPSWVSQLSQEEFQKLLGTRAPANFKEPPLDPALKDRDFPERFDWREMNGVTPVRNQGNCGSCWAFAAMGVIESQVYITTGTAPDYSEQQVVDCDPLSYGCSGGDYTTAWEYLKSPGAAMEADYPYHAVDQQCQDTQHDAYVRVAEWHEINSSVESIKAALQDIGPVATVMGANSAFQHYSEGCFSDSSSQSINHGVLIVGWDDTICDGGSWIVKNSWGRNWGEDGFFHIHRGDLHIGEYPAVATFEEIPPVQFQLLNHKIHDGGNDRIEGGETVQLDIVLRNFGREAATGISVALSCSDPKITIVNNDISVPDIPAKSNAHPDQPFTITAADDLQPALELVFTITVTASGISNDLQFTHFTGPLFAIYNNNFESGTDEGWSHGYTLKRDNWMRGITPLGQQTKYDPLSAHSGMKAWGNNYNNGGEYISKMANYLESPIIDCSGFTHVYLKFWRWLSVEEGIYDHARVLVNDQVIYENQAHGHTIDKEWVQCVYDISDIVALNSQIQIQFTLDSDEALNFGGWNIDDLSLFAAVDDSFKATYPNPIKINIATSQAVFGTGDPFILTYSLTNYRTAETVDEWVILDAGGQYWFWPEWTTVPSSRTRTIQEYCASEETLLNFVWPGVSGHMEGMRFWAAALDHESQQLLDYGSTEWGW